MNDCSEEEQQKEHSKVLDVAYAASRENSIFGGHAPGGYGMLQYQISGTKLLAVMDSREARRFAAAAADPEGSGKKVGILTGAQTAHAYAMHCSVSVVDRSWSNPVAAALLRLLPLLPCVASLCCLCCHVLLALGDLRERVLPWRILFGECESRCRRSRV